MSNLLSINGTQPDISLERGNAWRCTYDFQEYVLKPWLVHAPSFSDKWSHYFMLVMRLKDKNGYKTDEILYPYASHQMIIFALDPEQQMFVNAFPHFITPPCFSGQWFCNTDERAIEMLDRSVIGVCNGFMDPTAKEKDDWVVLFGASSIEKDKNDYSYILTKASIN